jgi:uncharacterized protein YegL
MMRRKSAEIKRNGVLLAVAAAVALILAGGALPVTRAQRAAQQVASPTPTATLLPGACYAWGDKVASPRVTLGDTAGVTLTFKAECRGALMRLHVVFVLDASEAMKGDLEDKMTDAVNDLVAHMDLPNNPYTEVAVVEFNDVAQTLAPLTNDPNRIATALARLRCQGAAKIHKGIDAGLRVMARGRKSEPGVVYDNEVMILISQGRDVDGCDAMLRSASSAKGQGVLMVTVCAGNDCDAACMRQAASSVRYFFQLEDASGLWPIFERIRHQIQNIVMKKVTVRDVLPSNMRYVVDSAAPPATEINPGGNVLTWESTFVSPKGLTYTYRVEPLELGDHPANVEAVATYVDNRNQVGSFAYAVPLIEVGPRPTATATPTHTSTPTVAATATPTATVTATPTPRARAILLPALVRGASPP